MASSLGMQAQPGEITGALDGRCHDKKFLVTDARDRDVGLHTASLVQPRRIDNAADGDVHVVRGQALKQRKGIRPLHQKVREGGLVEQRDAGAGGGMLRATSLEPFVPAKRCMVFIR
ncbi:hypothetical protein AJ88_37105 [Mesorhizobium amorphae CCBAU 01583]|nr:hypothetical protein AJ88_37105 [Mesorhizobium amorphae CCBAU 01583]